jgi:hypothetical protein
MGNLNSNEYNNCVVNRVVNRTVNIPVIYTVNPDINRHTCAIDSDLFMLKTLDDDKNMRDIITRIQKKLDRGEFLGENIICCEDKISYTDAELEARKID